MKIVNIRKVEGEFSTWDLTVPGNHNFYIGESGDILTHNCDGMSAQAQQALRNFCEEFSENHSVFFTCNFPNKVSDAIKSRSIVLDFKPSKSEKLAMLSEIFKRISFVLEKEGVTFDKKAVLELANKKFPDFRSCIKELQRYSMGGKIDSGILLDMTDSDYAPLFDALKNRKYKEMRSWVANHVDSDTTHIFRTMYEKSSEKIEPMGIPALVLLIGSYSYKAAFVADQEINLAAFFTEVMTTPEIKFN